MPTYQTAEYRNGKLHATTDGHSTLCMPWRKDATVSNDDTDDVDCPVCAKRLPYLDSDVTTAAEEYKAIQDDIDDYDGPVTAVFSWGYGEVWADGEVTAFGQTVFTVDADGKVS